MNQKELEKFYKEECMPGLVKLYQDIFAELQGKENFYREEWLKQINTLFEQICEKQTKVEVGKLGYIHFVFLRTNVLANEDTLVAYGYDKHGYFGQEYILGTINVSYFMDKFRNLWKELERLSLKYIGKVTKIDIKRLMLEESSSFFGVWFSMLRQYRREWVKLPAFLNIEKESYFRVQIGEYFEPPVVLYVMNKAKQEKEIKKKIRREKMLNGYDFRECNLDSLEFFGKELCDSFWENASTREVQWKQSDLRGAVFQNTIMTGNIFKESFLQETEWYHTNLENSRFEMVFLEKGRKYIHNYPVREYQPVKFEQCNLKNVTFEKCILDGVDFTNAVLTGSKFVDTSMKQCKLKREQLAEIQLDEIAQQEICMIE